MFNLFSKRHKRRNTLKTILCYGDSNTWGSNPATGKRLASSERWPGVLQQALGNRYVVIEEGLSGRTTVWDDPIEGRHKNGHRYLLPCLESHQPLDLVTIMLGTNDLKSRFTVSAYDIAQGAGVLVDIVQRSDVGPNGDAPRVLLLVPPPLGKLTELAEMFEGAEAKSVRFSACFQRVAAERRCDFLDTSEVIVSSEIDGIHLAASEHQKLGKAVATQVRKIIG
jgi:lysophospholipase L1-like esterase